LVTAGTESFESNVLLKHGGKFVHRTVMSPKILSSGWFIFFLGKGNVAHCRKVLALRDHPFGLRTS